MASPVTPVPGTNTQIVTGGTPVVVFNPNINGGFLQNPATAADQGLGAVEDIFVDPTGAPAGSGGFGTTFRVAPGGIWNGIPGQTTTTSFNAASNGHRIAAVQY